jgi:hypothetical protein
MEVMRVRFLRALGVTAIVTPLSIGAQRAITISSVATPSPLQVRVTRRVILSDAKSPTKDGNIWVAAIDSRHRYYVRTYFEDRFLVFDSTGKFIRSVGRRGRGPGEYFSSMDRLFVAKGDTILVNESRTNLTTLSPQYQYVRRAHAQMDEPIHLRSGGFAYIARGPSHEETNWPHRLAFADGEGTVKGTYDIGPVLPKQGPFNGGRLAPIVESPQGTVWCGMSGEYLIDEWDAAGKQRTVLTRKLDGPLFRDLAAIPSNKPGINDMRFDREGRLWVIVAMRNGKSHRENVRTERGMQEMDLPDYDWIIEVIDVRNGKLLASTRVPSQHLRFVDEKKVWHSIEMEDGSNGLEVLDVSLVPKK